MATAFFVVGAAAHVRVATPATTPATAPAARTSGAITVNINGSTVPVEPPPVMRSGAVLVPLRGVLEKLGAQVDFEVKEGRISVTQGTRIVVLRVGSTSAVADARSITISTAPQLIDNRAFVPLRALAELFGFQVQWIGGSNTVAISTGANAVRNYADHSAALRAAGPFGVTVDLQDTSDEEITKLLDAAHRAGAGLIKFRFDWGTLEPNKGDTFQWPTYDRVVREARQRNLVVVGILGDSAPWSSIYGDSTTSTATDKQYGPPAEKLYPNWQNYVKRTVGRYKNDVHAWQVWESPTSEKFRSVARVYREVTKLAVDAAREADPKAIIHAADPGGVNLNFLSEMKTTGLFANLDGVTLFPASQEQPGVPAQPEDFLLPFATLRERLAGSSELRHVWIGGLTWPVLDSSATIVTNDEAVRERLLRTFTPQAQSDYLMRAATLGLATGAGKMFWGELRDESTYERVEPFNPEFHAGLLARDFTPRPAFAAFQTVARLVSDKPFAGPLSLGPDMVGLVFDNREQTSIAAWALGGGAKIVMNSSGIDPKVPNAVYVSTLPDSKILDSSGEVLGGADGVYTLSNHPVWITKIGHETSEAVRARSKGKPLRVVPRQVDYSAVAEVRADFTEKGGEKGVFWRKYSNFRGVGRKFQEADGKTGLLTEVSRDMFNPAAGKPFIFMDVADSYLYFARGVPVTVTVEVHKTVPSTGVLGAVTGGFNLQYDSVNGPRFSNWQEVASGSGWATYTFKLPDVSFANRDGYDLKINTLGSRTDLLFGAVTVRKDA